MAQQVLHALYVSSGSNRNSRGGVPEIMRSCIWPPDTLCNSFEGFIEGRYSQMSAHRICKNKIIRVIPQFPGSKAILSLPLSFCPQILKCDFRRLYLPGLSVLRAGGNVVRRVFLLFLLELLADGNSLGFKSTCSQESPRHSPSRNPANRQSA